MALVCLLGSSVGAFGLPAAADEVFGPPNLLRTMATPFGSPQAESGAKSEFSPMTLSPPARPSLSSRLLPPRLYLPGRMVLGQSAEFIVKGRPGYWAALAMADKDSGAKPVCGREIKLGADRKLVSLGIIPESGVLSLFVETPIQGDLIGQNLYFEAAIWSRPDFSDVEFASPVASETQLGTTAKSNAVLVGADSEKKRGFRIVPEAAIPMQQKAGGGAGLDTGRP